MMYSAYNFATGEALIAPALKTLYHAVRHTIRSDAYHGYDPDENLWYFYRGDGLDAIYNTEPICDARDIEALCVNRE